MIKLHIAESYHYNTNQIVYNGSNTKVDAKDFDTNRIPCFFSPYKEYSASYGPIVNAYRLNIQNPFILDNQTTVSIYNNEFIPYAKSKGWATNWPENIKSVNIGDKINFVVVDYLYPFLRRMKRKGIYNYDGIICSEGNTYYDDSYVPLDSSQISNAIDIE
jgi:hypothetical protein